MELTGRITADAKIKTLKDERKVVTFTVAINETYKTKSGEKKEKSTFFTCSYWVSVKIAEHLTKGSIVQLHGSVGINIYKNLDGEAVGFLTFHVNNLQLIQKGKKGAEAVERITEPAKETEDLPF